MAPLQTWPWNATWDWVYFEDSYSCMLMLVRGVCWFPGKHMGPETGCGFLEYTKILLLLILLFHVVFGSLISILSIKCTIYMYRVMWWWWPIIPIEPLQIAKHVKKDHHVKIYVYTLRTFVLRRTSVVDSPRILYFSQDKIIYIYIISMFKKLSFAVFLTCECMDIHDKVNTVFETINLQCNL